MPVVKKTSGGRIVVRGIGEFIPDEEADVSKDDAQYLVDERGDFVRLDSSDEDEPTDDAAFDFDPAGHDDFETNGWLENDYQDRAEAVRAGGLDDFLNEIEDAERSDTVLEAIDERRAELEE